LPCRDGNASQKNGDREGLSLCGVKVSGCTMLPQALRCYAPKNPTISIVGVVRRKQML